MMTGAEIIQRAREQMAQLTGLKPDTASGLSRDEEGWHVAVELIEAKRIPDADDVLGTYETVLDDEGNLLRYQRTKRYLRGEVWEAPRR